MTLHLDTANIVGLTGSALMVVAFAYSNLAKVMNLVLFNLLNLIGAIMLITCDILGRVTWTIPYAGYLITLLSLPVGVAFVVGLALASRPWWQVVRQSAADPGARVVAGLQQLEALRLARRARQLPRDEGARRLAATPHGIARMR